MNKHKDFLHQELKIGDYFCYKGGYQYCQFLIAQCVGFTEKKVKKIDLVCDRRNSSMTSDMDSLTKRLVMPSLQREYVSLSSDREFYMDNATGEEVMCEEPSVLGMNNFFVIVTDRLAPEAKHVARLMEEGLCRNDAIMEMRGYAKRRATSWI